MTAPIAAVLAGPPSASRLAANTTAFLQKFVNKEGQVNYEAIQHDPTKLNALLDDIGSFEVNKVGQADQYAFYLNAYNMLVIGEIVARYPLASVRDIPGFFDRNKLLVAGEMMTLDHLEEVKLRQAYADPRLNFALSCGTAGCPQLSRTAYVGHTLYAQLTAQAQRVLQSPEFVQIDVDRKKVQLSEIFRWHEDEFTSSGKPGVMYVNQYREGDRVPTWFEVDYYSYNWQINEFKTPLPNLGAAVFPGAPGR